jgi:FkbM family methyltransferase
VTGVAKHGLHSVLRRLGVDLVRYGPERFPDLRRIAAIRDRRVDLVLDVGANVGHWAQLLRSAGYDGRIVSFEPLDDAYAALRRSAEADPHWEARQVALSDTDGESTINISGNLPSSSLLPMAELHAESAPESAYVGTQTIETRRLDTLRGDVVQPSDRIFMKLDVQGFELPALRGAVETLAQVQALEAELSYAELYAGQALLPEVIAYLHDAGLDLVGVEPVHSDPRTGDLLQVDGFFVRRSAR